MLSRAHCHYCTFAKPPAKLQAPFLLPEEVLAVAEAGRRPGGREARVTLRRRPPAAPAARLAERGGPAFGSPDKVPAVRIRPMEDAGRLGIPFTTGIHVGISE